MKTIRQGLILYSLIFLMTTIVSAQSSGGSLGGSLFDSSGGAVSGAKVTLQQVSTGRQFETLTTSEGLYTFPNLDVGSYTLVVEQSGFKKYTQKNIVIALSTRTTADIKLEIGDVNQSVTVTAEAVGILQPTSAEVSSNFAPKLFRDAPINAGGLRNPETFVAYQAGVVNGAGAEGGIGGGARRSKEILIDGANATNPESGGVAFNGLPTIEQLVEFKIINNAFAAEYGRTGGGIETFVTASGGNQFHGSLFDYHTSSALNANAWANKANPGSEIRKIPTHGNEYGFVLGGPIYLPKKVFGPIGGYNENKTKSFFFFTYNGFRKTDSSTQFITVPTLRQRQGCFDEVGVRPVYDINTGAQFPGNCIPQNRFSAISRNILPLIPNPTNNALTQNYLAARTSSTKQDSWSIKINHNITDKHLISGWFNTQQLDALAAGPLPGPLFGANQNAISSNKPQFARFNYDWIITPKINLHVTYGITRLRQYFDNPSVGQGWPQQLGLRGVSEGDTNAFPVITFSDGRYQNYADTNGPKTKGTQFNYTDHVRGDLSWIKGNHSFKLGAESRWMRTTGEPLSTGGFDDAGVQGQFAFSPNQTALRSSSGTTGDSFASFLLGYVSGASRTYNANASSANFGYHAWYGQTDWRIRPNLTLNLGLRYEIPVPRSTSPTAFTSFDPNLIEPTSGLRGALAYLGDCNGCVDRKSFANIDYSNFGPRFGLAWSPTQKTVVRAGFGVYYGAGNGLTGGFCIRCQNGYGSSAGLSSPDSFLPALLWDNGFVPSPSFQFPPIISPSAGNAVDDIWYISPESGRAPRFTNWTFSVQRELPFKLFAEVAYIGMRGVRLSANHRPLNHLDPKYYALGDLLNQRIDSPAVVAAGYRSPYANFISDWGSTATLARALRPYPHINGPVNNEYNPIGNSWYDSLQVKLDRRFGDLFAEFNYTWSKSLTNASGSQTSGDWANRNPIAENPFAANVLDIQKSYQYTDRPHIFNVVAAYDLPFGRGKRFLGSNAFVERLVGGWTVSFAGQYQSGDLVLLNAPLTYPNWGGGNFLYGRKRVNLTGAPLLTGVSRGDLDPRDPNSRWLNPAAFSIPGTFELGTAPVYLNDLREPRFYSDSMGLIKRTRIAESVNLEIRGEFFNVFNRTNFGGVGTGVNQVSPRPNTANLATYGRPLGARSGPRSGQVVVKLNF
jgi:hypothetical protein